MPLTLPRNPNLEHLKKSAKQLLAAHRRGELSSCRFLRHLHQFQDATDEEILAAQVTLHDVQLLVALLHGFASWQELRRHVLAARMTNDLSLESVVQNSSNQIPIYAGAGVPLAVVAALRQAGVDIDFAEFVAASGWAFSFGYRYNDISPAFLAVAGHPDRDGPFEIFAFLPRLLGFGYEMARTEDHEALWSFAQRHVDAGTPIMSEHLDGGLITGHHEQDGVRQLCFDGTVGSGWVRIDGFNPYAVYILVPQKPAMPRAEIISLALERAVAKGSSHDWQGTPQGLSALDAYLADVADPSKDFSDTEEWFCWAAFSRLMARRCAEIWLHAVAAELAGRPRELVQKAAEYYGRAFAHYDRFRTEVSGSEPAQLGLRERARTPERIDRIVPVLQQGIKAEAAGLELLKQAVRVLGS